MSSEWCLRHATRFDESGVPRYIAETLIVQTVLDNNLLDETVKTGCWACAVSEKQFQDAIREAGRLDAETDKLGGTFTSEKLAIYRGANGEKEAYPTDKESSEK